MAKPTDEESTYICPVCDAVFTVSAERQLLGELTYCCFCGEYVLDWEEDDDERDE